MCHVCIFGLNRRLFPETRELLDEEEEMTENPLRPIVRMDQWCLVRDFFLSCQHMASASERLGQPHRASYWLDQGKEFASRLGLISLCLKYSLDCVRNTAEQGHPTPDFAIDEQSMNGYWKKRTLT